MTGIGPVCVRQPRVRDRQATEGERIRYSPSILPRYARRSKSLEVLIPILYLKGISTGDLEEALAALVGTDAPGLASDRRFHDLIALHDYSLAYLNSGGILRLSFVPPGSINLLSTSFRES
jgi:hypothetical protein